MAQGMVRPRKPAIVQPWVFRWRPLGRPLFPRIFALVFVGGCFAFLITSVRVRVDAMEKSTPRKASVIFLRDDAQGRALRLRAQEGGPFPSRFELSQWGGLALLENSVMDAIRFESPAYEPKLEPLPTTGQLPPLAFATKGERFFPEHPQPPENIPDSSGLRPSPVLFPLSGASVPDRLPPFEAAVDAAMSAASWRFLLRLNAEGTVMECVSLENTDQPGALELEKWLRRVPFEPKRSEPSRWIAVGVGFTNQPGHGADPR
jgi:hypothetical protein